MSQKPKKWQLFIFHPPPKKSISKCPINILKDDCISAYRIHDQQLLCFSLLISRRLSSPTSCRRLQHPAGPQEWRPCIEVWRMLDYDISTILYWRYHTFSKRRRFLLALFSLSEQHRSKREVCSSFLSAPSAAWAEAQPALPLTNKSARRQLSVQNAYQEANIFFIKTQES